MLAAVEGAILHGVGLIRLFNDREGGIRGALKRRKIPT